MGYPLEQLYQEVAYIAYYFHWNPDDDPDIGSPISAPLGDRNCRY